MQDLFIVLNHRLSKEQQEDVRKNHGVGSISYLPEELQKIWAQVSPEGELDTGPINKIVDWLKEKGKKDDLVLIQGEFGTTFYVVDFCFETGLIPVYASSRREYEEKINEDGSVTRKHLFRHSNFRMYKKYKGTC